MAEESKTTKKAAPKKATAKAASATSAPRKRAVKKADAETELQAVEPVAEVTVTVPEAVKAETVAPIKSGRYIFSTGRRKSAVANIRLFEGKGQSTVNRKAFDVYFSHAFLRDEAMQAFRFTGMNGQYYFNATVHGGGIKAQAQAVRHGIAQSLASLGEETRRVLKKNGLLTRDPREKERKKPGLRRARRAPQWAKR